MRRGLIAAALVAGLSATAAPAAGRAGSYYEYCLARQAWLRRDFSDALDHMKRAVAADPEAPDLALEFSRLSYEADQVELAVETARRAVQLAPDSADARRSLAESLLAMVLREGSAPDLAVSAADAYQAVIERDPEDADAYLNLGKLRLSLKQVPEALEALRRHLVLAPRSDEGAFLAAQALLRLSRQDEAIALLEEYVNRRPDSPQLLVALMESYEGAERLQEAAAAGERLLRLKFDVLRTRLALARINQRLGRHDQAVVNLTEAARVMNARGSEFTDADRAGVSLRIVQVLLDAGRPEEALASAGSGADRFPADPRFELKKGEALLMQGLAARAEKLFKEVRSAHKDDDSGLVAQISDVYLSAGARLERAKDYEGAEKHLKRAIEVNPDNSQALNYLGYMLADRSVHLDEAIGYIRKALERDPDNGAYLDSLGWAYFRKGEYVRAEKALASAIVASPDEAEIHAHMGELYSATGRLMDAIEAWQDALRHGIPNAEDIRAKVAAAQEKTAPAPR